MRILATIVTLLSLATASASDGYILGKGGFYWKHGQAYTRSLESGGYYYRSNCCTYYAPAVYTYSAVIESEDFWEILAKGAANEKEKKLRLAALEVVTGYSAQSGYSQTLSLYGPTALGYSPKFAEPADYGKILQDYFLGKRELTALNAQADAGATAVASQIAANDQEAQFRAFALKVLESARPSAVIKQDVRGLPSVNTQPLPELPRALGGKHPAVVSESCVSCHSGAKPAGGHDFSDWSRVEPVVRAKAAGQIYTGQMPPPEDVKSGRVKAVDKARAKEIFE